MNMGFCSPQLPRIGLSAYGTHQYLSYESCVRGDEGGVLLALFLKINFKIKRNNDKICQQEHKSRL